MTQYNKFHDDKLAEHMSQWLDNELPPKQAAALSQHIETNTEAQQLYQRMQQVDAIFQEAATTVMAPPRHFHNRVEAQLMHLKPISRWRIIMGLSVLVLGLVFFIALGAGIAVTNLPATLPNASVVNDGLDTVVRSINFIQVVADFGGLFAKTIFIALQQPLLWGYLVLAGGLTYLWVRVMQTLYRGAPSTPTHMLAW